MIGIGNSNSEIYFVEEKESCHFNSYIGIIFTQKKTEIQSLVSSFPDNLLICGDSEGCLNFFYTKGIKEVEWAKSLDSSTKNTPITTMDTIIRSEKDPNLSNLLVCGDFIGKIQIYCLKDFY